jgi:hypothetical protein
MPADLKSLDKVVDQALSVRDFRKPKYRPVPFFWGAKFSWTVGTDSLQSEKIQTLVNAAPGELRLHRIWYNVSFSGEGASMTPQPCGIATTGTMTSNSNLFDFEWQMSFPSSGHRIGVPGHNVVSSPYVSRTALETFVMSRRLNITPLRLGLNESVTISVRPTALFAYTGSPTYVLHMGFEGARSYA